MNERIVEIGTRKHTKVVCTAKPSHGGACQSYCVMPAEWLSDVQHKGFARVQFQEGPVEEVGVNGCHHEDLIVVVIDRLQHYQAGEYACRENDQVLTKLEEALMWLRKRTTDRENRGVEGTSTK